MGLKPICPGSFRQNGNVINTGVYNVCAGIKFYFVGMDIMSQTTLKIIALICMTIDHIGTFIPGAPDWLHIIGRVSAPIFIFCLVVGFDKTHNRRKMLIRLYILSVTMAALNTISNLWLFDRFSVENNIFQTLFCILLLIELMSQSRKKVILYLLAGVVSTVLIFVGEIFHIYPFELEPLIAAVIGNPFMTEGNLMIVILGLLMHRFYRDKRKLSISLAAFFGFEFANAQFFLCARAVRLIEPVTGVDFDTFAFIIERTLGIQTFPAGFSMAYSIAWMGIFALPLFLLYNGQRGRGFKKFFYIYYPVHIYLLAFARLLIGEPPIPDDFVDILGEG